MEDGARRIVRAGEAFDIPPGHLSRVVGNEPYVCIEFVGVRGWAKPPEAGERVVATLLVTDIVGSTDVAVRLGDAAWKELLARHGDGVRRELDRFRGLEATTTGDGFLAFFDGAARAVQCAGAIRDRAAAEALPIRAGVHSGEVERHAGNVAVSQSMPSRGSRRSRSRARCWSPGRLRACSRGPASASKTRASTSSRACPADAASTD